MEKEIKKEIKKEFEINSKFNIELRNFFGKKSFIDVVDVIQILKKNIISENEINIVLNALGKYPYDEVEVFFINFKNNIKELPIKENKEKEVKKS